MISPDSHILMMGSCFSTEIGSRLSALGYDVILNPFGILFNPASIANALQRMEKCEPFRSDDVICRTDDASQGKYRYVSYHHHGSFARASAKEFLDNANSSLICACREFQCCDTIILTLGTSWVFRHIQRNLVVANCHKVPASEFSREFISSRETAGLLAPIIQRNKDKTWILTVSPVKHLADGEEGNRTSKESLIKAVSILKDSFPETVSYFPSFEIVTSLPDGRGFKNDGSHPSEEAVNMVFEKFISSALPFRP